MLSLRPRVTRRSICGRSSFAFGSVVTMRSLSISDASWLRNSARRCPDVRPSLRLTIPCLMSSPTPFPVLPDHLLGGTHPRAARRGACHTERQPEAGENVFDLVERLAAEVLGGEHLPLGALHEVAQRADVRVLQAIRGANREIELLDRLGQHLGQARIAFRSGGVLGILSASLESAEDPKMVAEELGGEAHGFLRRNGAVRP